MKGCRPISAIRDAVSIHRFGYWSSHSLTRLQVLSIVGNVSTDELSLRMPRDHAVARGEQFIASRIIVP